MNAEIKKSKRLAVAQDALARFNEGQYFVDEEGGGYYANVHPVQDDPAKVTVEKALEEPCQVCALGALFCSYVLKRRPITWDTLEMRGHHHFERLEIFIGTAEIQGLLPEIFQPWELILIERFFEGYNLTPSDNHKNAFFHEEMLKGRTEEEVKKIVRRLSALTRTESCADRFVRIMNNIIENDGDFKPELL